MDPVQALAILMLGAFVTALITTVIYVIAIRPRLLESSGLDDSHPAKEFASLHTLLYSQAETVETLVDVLEDRLDRIDARLEQQGKSVQYTGLDMPGEALAIRDEYEQIAALLEAQSGSLSRIGARLDDWTTTRAAEQDRLAEQSRILADLDREIATHTTLLTEASAERRKQITLLEHGIERLAQVFPLLNRLLSSPPRPDQDRLTDIKGIGPVYAGKLYEAGIQTFRQLAAMTPDELYALINEPSWRMKSIKAESWIAQAGHLASQREKVEAIQ